MTRVGWALLAGACVVAFVGHPLAAALALALAVAAGLALDRPVLVAVLRAGLILAFVFAAAATGAVVTWSAGLERGLVAGSALLGRLLVLTLAAGLVARRVDSEAILAATHRGRLERLGLVLGLALNALPRLVVALRDVRAAQAVRCRGRWLVALAAAPRLAEVALAHTARVAEEAAAAAALRGHTALLEARAPLPARTRVVLVTGPRGCGKSEAMAAAVARWQEQGGVAAGFLQPGIWEGARKVGFRVLDVATGEQCELARRVEVREGQHGTTFRFSDAGLALARRALGAAAPGALLVVDELGPVELRGKGHMSAVRRALATPGLAAAALVVRRQLAPSLLDALAAEDAVVVNLDECGDDAAEAILGAINGTAVRVR